MNMIEQLYKSAVNYGAKRETYMKIQESQRHLVKGDLEVADGKFRDAINDIVDARIKECTDHNPTLMMLKENGDVVPVNSKNPNETPVQISSTIEGIRQKLNNDKTPYAVPDEPIIDKVKSEGSNDITKLF